MQEFKNKEDYEAWKAERLKGSQKEDFGQSDIRSFPESAHSTKRKMWIWAIPFVAIAIVFLGHYLYVQYQQRAEHQAYIKEVSIALSELEKLSATLEVGISYMDYTKRLGEINYPVSVFLSKYKNNSSQKPPISYQAVDIIMMRYLHLQELWKTAIESRDSDILSITLKNIRSGWAILSQELKLSRQLFEKKDDQEVDLRQKFVAAENFWNDEVVLPFKQEIAAYENIFIKGRAPIYINELRNIIGKMQERNLKEAVEGKLDDHK